MSAPKRPSKLFGAAVASNKSSPFEAFNLKLIDNKTNINLLDYVKQCNFTNIDISFIDKFIELVPRTDFCIPHTYLKDYGVYKLTGGSSDLENKL